MACFRPLQVHYAPGSGGVSFSGRGIPTEVPCGHCVGCRKEQARQWATRCMHECAMHAESCFITLTYSDEHLPWPPTLEKREHQLFMKRLRKALAPRKISFFLCGEYGDKYGRPHYHAIIFGWWPKDATKWKMNSNGEQLYTSGLLDRVWNYGFTSVGAVTFGSALYVAGYVVKKQQKLAKDASAYTWLDQETGEFVCIEPEYAVQSRRPAIGKRWLEKFGETDAFRHDKIVAGGVQAALPRYYDKQLAKAEPERAEAVKRARAVARFKRGRRDESRPRRRAREAVELARINLRKREVE